MITDYTTMTDGPSPQARGADGPATKMNLTEQSKEGMPQNHINRDLHSVLQREDQGLWGSTQRESPSARDLRDVGSIPGSGQSPGVRHGNPLQYYCLENPMDRSLAGYGPHGHKESDTTEVT